MLRVAESPAPFWVIGGALIVLSASAFLQSGALGILGFGLGLSGFVILILNERVKSRWLVLAPGVPLLLLLLTPTMDLLGGMADFAGLNVALSLPASTGQLMAAGSVVAAVAVLVVQWGRSRALWLGIAIAAFLEGMIFLGLAAGVEGVAQLPLRAASLGILGMTAICITVEPSQGLRREFVAQQP